VPNKFPALRIEGELHKSGEGLYDKMNGIGAHEVIIETPKHPQDRVDIDSSQVKNTLLAAKFRILDLKKDTRFKYIMVFKNFGPTAGATLSHSHSQLIALPVVPLRVQEEIAGASTHFQMKERCIFCDIIHYESEADRRLLLENEHFIVLAPYAPRFSFELAVYPKKHNPAFESISEVELDSLGTILSTTLAKVARALNHPDYNLIIHNAPCSNNVADFYHWHIEFMPVLARVAGFEWGTGFYINPISPEESVQALKAI
jgi:UDPglucose--hexose-1-phosphate uridylyltransferase